MTALPVMQRRYEPSVVIPTYQEAGNIGVVVEELCAYGFRVLVVDDNSSDGTAFEAEKAGAQVIVRRVGRGLGSAVRAGASAVASDFVLVMDGDGQHRPEDALRLTQLWLKEHSEITLGSRFAPGAVLQGLSPWRKALSLSLNTYANALARSKCSDPMTGFFIAPVNLVKKTQTNGYKILFEMLYNQHVSISELGINFQPRKAGSSKATIKELWQLTRTPKWRTSRDQVSAPASDPHGK